MLYMNPWILRSPFHLPMIYFALNQHNWMSGNRVQFGSVAQSCPTLCDPMDCSTPGPLSITNSRSLLKVMCIESVMPSNHPILCLPFSSCPQSSPASGAFAVSWLFASGGQSIAASASASVLPMNIQAWFPLGLTGLRSCCTRDSKASSPAPHFKSINSLAVSLLNGPTLTFIHVDLKNHNFDYMDLCQQSDISAFLIHCLDLS